MFNMQKNKLRNICAILLMMICFVGLAGCKKGKEEVSEYDKTLVGIDEDGDGIRDEIAAKMKKEFKDGITYEEQKVMNLHAQVFQEILNLDLENRTDVLLARSHLDDAINCAIIVFGEDFRFDNYTVIMTNLRQWYFNTKERKEHHREFINRSKEYHYQKMLYNGANTCDFEFSDELKAELKRREEYKKQKEAAEAAKQNANKQDTAEDAKQNLNKQEASSTTSVDTQ